jgi:hypothetical protein
MLRKNSTIVFILLLKLPDCGPQIDVFNAFIDLLRQTGNVTKGSGDIRSSR